MQKKFFIVLLSALLLSACATTTKQDIAFFKGNQFDFDNLIAMVPDNQYNDKFVRSGLEALKKGDLAVASKHFNHALKFDPSNANLHFLNAFTYHFRALAGDSSQYEMAKVGYDLALRYDPGNYWASYLLGDILVREQNFRKAQDAFAYSVLFAPKNPAFLNALAAASYRSQDIATAIASIEKARKLAPENKQYLYNQTLIEAAAGRTNMAHSALKDYGDMIVDNHSFRFNHLADRVNDWGNFYQANPGIKLAGFGTDDIFGSADTNVGLSVNTNKKINGGKKVNPKSIPIAMVLVDVIIIRSEERNTTIKGVNLLSGLSSTLSGNLFSYNNARTITTPASGASTSSITKAFTINPAFSLAASYSLNIFNDNNDRNEVLARPTLVALNGKKSEFFSGSIFKVELTGAAGSLGGVEEVPVGIKLEVTPNFKSDNIVELHVSAARAFIEGRSADVGFNNFAQITKTLVNANATMKFGDTLVLSGLSERETENLKDGVPILQDIPGLQYLFSSNNTLDFTKSVLILLTPRKPRYTYEDGTTKIDPQNPDDKDIKQPNLSELKNKDGWFKPASNLDAVFYHLRDGKFFKEFRSGDVAVERWAEPYKIDRILKRVLSFLYY